MATRRERFFGILTMCYETRWSRETRSDLIYDDIWGEWSKSRDFFESDLGIRLRPYPY